MYELLTVGPWKSLRAGAVTGSHRCPSRIPWSSTIIVRTLRTMAPAL